MEVGCRPEANSDTSAISLRCQSSWSADFEWVDYLELVFETRPTFGENYLQIVIDVGAASTKYHLNYLRWSWEAY